MTHTVSIGLSSAPARASRLLVLCAGTAAIVIVALPSGTALLIASARCDSNPAGDASNPQWTFSSYCKALAFHSYTVAANDHAPSMLAGVFGLPAVVLCGTIIAMRLRRLTPLKRAFWIGLVLSTALLVLGLSLPAGTFYPCC